MMRYKKDITQKLAEGLTLLALGVACQWPVFYRYIVEIGMLMLAVVSITVWCRQSHLLKSKQKTITVSFVKIAYQLLKSQAMLLTATLIMLIAFCYHTQSNTRLQPLELITLLSLVKRHYGSVIIAPWILYLSVGLGSAYFIQAKRPAFLAGMICPLPGQIGKAFWYRYSQFCTHAILVSGIVCMAGSIILLLSDGVSRQMYFPAVSKMPVRAGFFLLFLLWISRKWKKKVFKWLIVRYKVPLGFLIAIYLIALILALIWLHEFFVICFGEIIPLSGKNPWLGRLTETNRDNRLITLLLSWWLAWLPYMSSWIARWALQTNFWKVAFAFLWLPLIILPIILFQLPFDTVFRIEYLEKSSWQILLGGIGLILLMTVLWHVHNLKDFTKGFVTQEVTMYDRSLLKISLPIISKLTFLTAGYFALGWPIAQIILVIPVVYFMLTIGLFLRALWQTDSIALP